MKNELIEAIFALKPIAVKLGFEYPEVPLYYKNETEFLKSFSGLELGDFFMELADFIRCDYDSRAVLNRFEENV